MTPQLFSGSCSSPTHCCLATFPPTHLSTLLVNQSLHPTDSKLNNSLTYSFISFSEYCNSLYFFDIILSVKIVSGELPKK